MSDGVRPGSDWIVEPPPTPTLPIVGEEGRFPVVRIWCVGRNYEAHAREMESASDRRSKVGAPFFFLKPASALAPGGGPVPYPDDTGLLHHEVELVVALGMRGRKLSESEAGSLVYGYGVGLDLTRRDRQTEAKARGRPWSLAKGFDRSAPCSALMPESRVGPLRRGRITAAVNGEIRQDADLSEMIWSVPRTIALLSRQVEVLPGDLLFTGTPAGVGPVEVGDVVTAEVAGVGRLEVSVEPRDGG
ncbi:MAG: fumarylacetoacetate hydrolase family protein [marine benthic group bacterium]|mgnify:FL=1|nr:fumarylacetoacetate hydrolase family protein [Gemmatimonadota bacterium]